MDGALGNAGLFGDRAHAPMGGGLGRASEGLGDQRGHGLVLDRAGPTATHLVVEPLDAVRDESIAPFADRMGADAKPRRHHGVAGLALASQYDLRPQRQCRGQRTRPRYRQKMGAFIVGNREHRLRPSSSHRVSPSIRIPETHAIIMLRNTSVPIPKFAHPCSTLASELRNPGTLANLRF